MAWNTDQSISNSAQELHDRYKKIWAGQERARSQRQAKPPSPGPVNTSSQCSPTGAIPTPAENGEVHRPSSKPGTSSRAITRTYSKSNVAQKRNSEPAKFQRKPPHGKFLARPPLEKPSRIPLPKFQSTDRKYRVTETGHQAREIQELRNKARALRASRDAAVAQACQLREENDSAVEAEKEARDLAAAAKRGARGLLDRLIATEEETEKLRSQLAHSEKFKGEAETKAQDLIAQLTASESAKAEAKRESKVLKAQLARSRTHATEVDQGNQRLRDEVRTLTTERDDANSEIQRLRDQVDVLAAERDAVVALESELREEKDRLCQENDRQIRKLNDDLRVAQDHVERADDEVRRMNHEVHTLTTERNAAVAQENRLREEQDRAVEAEQQARDLADGFAEQAQELKGQLAASRKTATEVDKQNQHLRSEVDNLRAERATARNDVYTVCAQLDTSRDQVHTLTTQRDAAIAQEARSRGELNRRHENTAEQILELSDDRPDAQDQVEKPEEVVQSAEATGIYPQVDLLLQDTSFGSGAQPPEEAQAKPEEPIPTPPDGAEPQRIPGTGGSDPDPPDDPPLSPDVIPPLPGRPRKRKADAMARKKGKVWIASKPETKSAPLGGRNYWHATPLQNITLGAPCSSRSKTRAN